ncbi:hypothetical protein Hypma_008218 [Hypsizygus marmoreus]|uniref:Uncharacterized protein n=1 Tax=Hypsizygus marmoreus TaxID=39966 RepID=A0A369JTQ1_HYPMA|nr:hypothetical protein Hypma_008218 [Hypsizygus marmoreus]
MEWVYFFESNWAWDVGWKGGFSVCASADVDGFLSSSSTLDLLSVVSPRWRELLRWAAGSPTPSLPALYKLTTLTYLASLTSYSLETCIPSPTSSRSRRASTSRSPQARRVAGLAITCIASSLEISSGEGQTTDETILLRRRFLQIKNSGCAPPR